MAFDPPAAVMFLVVPALLGLLAGISAASEWKTLLLWRNAAEFGSSTPVRRRPVVLHLHAAVAAFVVDFLFAVVVLAFLGAVVVHYLYGGIWLQPPATGSAEPRSAHLSVLVGLFLLLKAVAYWLDRSSSRSRPRTRCHRPHLHRRQRGAARPDHPREGLAALRAAVLRQRLPRDRDRRRRGPRCCWSRLARHRRHLPGDRPASPGQAERARTEAPYIQRNIDATRRSYGAGQAPRCEASTTRRTAARRAIRRATGTIWTTSACSTRPIVSPTFRGAAADPRLLRASPHPRRRPLRHRRQAARHRDRGARAQPGRPRRRPAQLVQRPPRLHPRLRRRRGATATSARPTASRCSSSPGIPHDGPARHREPRVYFGEDSPAYSIVGGPPSGTPRELDYPSRSDGQDEQHLRPATAACRSGSPLQPAALRDQVPGANILLSDLINDESQILYDRDPRDRVEKVAPYLTLDSDPYPAVVDGRDRLDRRRLHHDRRLPVLARRPRSASAIADTVTQRASNIAFADRRHQLHPQLGQGHRRRVRRHGHALRVGHQDPVLKTWEKVFPGTVKPQREMPRGPAARTCATREDLFKVQRAMLSRYHVHRPARVLQRPGLLGRPERPDPASDRVEPQPPYYLTMQMPGHDGPGVLADSTFTPQRAAPDADRASWRSNSDAGPDYGKLTRAAPADATRRSPARPRCRTTSTSDPTVSSASSPCCDAASPRSSSATC